MDMVGRKEKTLLATTAGSTSLEQTISSVLGSKFLAAVHPVSIDLTPALGEDSPKGDWKMEGFISKSPDDGGGSGGMGAKAGQQYFSINGRPVELPKIARVLGDAWRTVGGGGKKKLSYVLTLRLPNPEYDVNLSPEKRQVLLTHEADICQILQTGMTELWTSQTEGQFTPSASQPKTAAAASKSSADTDDDSATKKPPPKVDNIETLLSLQESNRKRAREKYASAPTAPTRDNNMDDNVDAAHLEDSHQYGHTNHDSGEGEEQRRAYMRKFREQQKEQRKLNASRGDVDCQYGEEHSPDQKAPPPQEDQSPHRVRRRGGFVHDISTAKQWERPASIGRNFQIPEGIEDPSDSDEEAEGAATPEKRQRVEPPKPQSPEEEGSPPAATAEKPCVEEAAIGEQCSSRRVTLSLNNELAAMSSSTESLTAPNLKSVTTSKAASCDDGANDGDKLLWVDAQARFNQRDGSNLEKEIDVLTKTSVSPNKQSFETPHVTASKRTNTNSASALNLEQFAFGRREGSSEKRGDPSSASRTSVPQPAVSPEGEKETAVVLESTHREKTPTSRKTRKKAADDEWKDPCKAPRRPVVWGSFQGTESVVKLTKIERNRIEAKKEKLKQLNSVDEWGFEAMPNGTSNETKKVKLSKGDFEGMTVLGQFNLGFILALDKHCNLWILDQHACDERFNFERLMESTVMHEQTLLAPMPLELDISEENCVMDNLKIFAANGFKFKYDESKPPRHRLSLTALPHSGARDGRKAVSFGKEDVSALCSILGADSGSAFGDDNVGGGGGGGGTGADGSGMHGNNAVRRYAGSLSQVGGRSEDGDKVLIRLPKAIAMFASRACRGSIMIGTSLSKKQMARVVQRLDHLNDPFKCAHGRPTMTHLVNLQGDLLDDQRKAAELVTGATLSMSMTQMEEDPS